MMQYVHRVLLVNTQRLVQPLVLTVLQEITRQAQVALSKKLVPQAPTVQTKVLHLAIFAQPGRILAQGQMSAQCVVLATLPPLRVLLNV